MRERDPVPSRAALAAILVWVAALTAVFVLLHISPKGFPALLELQAALRALFYRDYVF